MKREITIFALILSVIAGSVGCKQSGSQSNELITVDVTAKYPKKELILQDFMDVEYIPLETNDEFVNQAFVQAIGREIIVVKNRIDDGDIFVYDRRTGKAIRKINRKGQGGEEYVSVSGMVLDEDQSEMFVSDNSATRILVYDLEGNFKRSFKYKKDAMYGKIYNFDQQNLICYDFASSNKGQSFAIISKQDGSITQEIQIPFEEKKSIVMNLRDDAKDVTYRSKPSSDYPILPVLNNWILVEPSSDTIYSYSSEHKMRPFLARTPSIQSMSPEVFLFLSVVTNRYCFMEIIKKEYDFETQQGFPSTDLMYDKQEKSVSRYTVYNNDYSNKQVVSMVSRPENNEIAIWHQLAAYRLVESYKKGELKGKLKEIAETLDEESNPVIMLIKYKK